MVAQLVDYGYGVDESNNSKSAVVGNAHATTTTNTVRNKYISYRRGSLAADLGDDDDMRDELDRLSVAQLNLQRELISCISMVDVLQAVVDDESSESHNDDNHNDGDYEASEEMHHSMALSSTRCSLNASQTSLVVEEDLSIVRKKTFANGFFALVIKPKETLESQKKRQMEIVKQNLKSIDPEMEQALECQRDMQDAMVLNKKQTEELKLKNGQKLQALMDQKTYTLTLEEEKQRQLEILKWNLQTIDPGLEDVMQVQQENQKVLVGHKRQEVAETKKLMNARLSELNLKNPTTKNNKTFW